MSKSQMKNRPTRLARAPKSGALHESRLAWGSSIGKLGSERAREARADG